MLIELPKGMTLHPGTFNAVIASGKVMISAPNTNADLQRFLFLYVSGNYSRPLSPINRSSKNFEVRGAFTAHQLFTILKEASHTILLLEHDPPLFDGAEEMIPQITGMLKEVSLESLVILYIQSADNFFSILICQTDRIIEIALGENTGRTMFRRSRPPRGSGPLPLSLKTPEVS